MTLTKLNGAFAGYYVAVSAAPIAPSQAIEIGILGETTYPFGTAAITGGGHIIGNLGRIINTNSTNAIPLAIGTECKIDNGVAGANITNAVVIESNLGSNVIRATIGNLYFLNANCANNAGTVSLLAAVRLDIINAGTISNAVAVYVPTLSAPGTINTSLYGLYFANQTGGGWRPRTVARQQRLTPVSRRIKHGLNAVL